MVESHKLTNLQIELLKIFSRPIPEHQVIEIKNILVDYFAKNVDAGIDELFANNNWGEDKSELWLLEHMLTPYID